MKFYNAALRLAKEVLALRRYKKMHLALAIFTGIFLAPMFLGFFFFFALLFLASTLFALMQAPLSYLHGIVREEGDRVKYATQVVIYIFSWPLLLFLYALYAGLTVFIYLAYLATTVCGYYVSLGGIKFHIEALYEDIYKDVEHEPRYKAVPAVFVGICAFLLLMILIFFIVYNTAEDWELIDTAYTMIMVFGGLYGAFVALYVPIAFNHKREIEVAPKEEPKVVPEVTE